MPSHSNLKGRIGHREAAVLIRLMAAPRVGPRKLSTILESLDAAGHDLRYLGDWSSADLQSELKLSEEASHSFLASGPEAEEILGDLHDAGVTILTRSDYSDRLEQTLGRQTPPVLFVAGNLSLLNASGVGFCGARNCSDHGLRNASTLAAGLARQGVNIVSGYAPGVDMAAHRASLEVGGSTTVVMAEGISRFRIKREIKDVWNDSSVLLVSEFHPRAGWTPANAMTRNRTICALADSLVVIEAGLKGGTYAAGEEALRLGRPLHVLEYENPPESAAGNATLIARGGSPLRIDTDQPVDASKVVRPAEAKGGSHTQQVMFDW